MDEDEEIDIIGNYGEFLSKNERDISNISSGQLLSCEYTVHPKWLNENPDGENYWSESVPKHENLENNVEVLQSEEVIIEEPEPVPNITDLEWGGEGGNLIFEEDIPATIEEVVADQETYCSDIEAENTCDEDQVPKVENNNDVDSKNGRDYLLEPAAFETHPPVENIGYIGPTKSTSLLKVKISSHTDQNPRSVLKPDLFKNIEKPPIKFKQTLTINQSLLKSNKMLVSQIRTPKLKNENLDKDKIPTTKFKQTVKIPSQSLQNGKLKIIGRKLLKGKGGGKRSGGGKGKRSRNSTNIDDANITISHESETPNVTQLESIQAPTMQKSCMSNSESDIEVDVETDLQTDNLTKSEKLKDISGITMADNNATEKENIQAPNLAEQTELDEKVNELKIFENLSETVVAQLKSMDVPNEELVIDANEISELEKAIYSEYFDNRTTKTPEQYLRIRNHILLMWKSSKPNYISKTAARSGLKHGGDVNCISRIHRFLEQIGAINFGCQGKNFDFVRPLENIVSLFVHTPRIRSNSSSNTSHVTNGNERRHRVKNNAAFSGKDKGSNFTIRHGEGGRRFESESLNKHHMRIRPYIRNVKTELQLIKCLKFSKDNIAPFKVSISLSTLLCLQLHLLSSKYEVMGFLGGHRSKCVGRDKISLTRYRPCRTAVQSGTMCEMCPVSQVEQSSKLGEEGYELLGWFHSHPLFPANPSRTDLRTQKEMQNQFAFDSDRPFIGVILSGLNMSFKCIYLMPRQSNFDDDFLPYEIDADIVKDYTNFKVYVRDVLDIIEENCDSTSDLIKKFKSSSSPILRQFGFKNDSFFVDIF